MLRVSVVREILNSRISASAEETSKPRAIVVPMPVAFRNPRRVTSIGSLLGSVTPAKSAPLRNSIPHRPSMSRGGFTGRRRRRSHARRSLDHGYRALGLGDDHAAGPQDGDA